MLRRKTQEVSRAPTPRMHLPCSPLASVGGGCEANLRSQVWLLRSASGLVRPVRGAFLSKS